MMPCVHQYVAFIILVYWRISTVVVLCMLAIKFSKQLSKINLFWNATFSEAWVCTHRLILTTFFNVWVWTKKIWSPSLWLFWIFSMLTNSCTRSNLASRPGRIIKQHYEDLPTCPEYQKIAKMLISCQNDIDKQLMWLTVQKPLLKSANYV